MASAISVQRVSTENMFYSIPNYCYLGYFDKIIKTFIFIVRALARNFDLTHRLVFATLIAIKFFYIL